MVNDEGTSRGREEPVTTSPGWGRDPNRTDLSPRVVPPPSNEDPLDTRGVPCLGPSGTWPRGRSSRESPGVDSGGVGPLTVP